MTAPNFRLSEWPTWRHVAGQSATRNARKTTVPYKPPASMVVQIAGLQYAGKGIRQSWHNIVDCPQCIISAIFVRLSFHLHGMKWLMPEEAVCEYVMATIVVRCREIRFDLAGGHLFTDEFLIR